MQLLMHEPVADCTFWRPDGTPVRLSEFPADVLVLVFLRHLA